MSTTINPGGPALPQPPASGARPAAHEAGSDVPAGAPAVPGQGSDSVQLTESARAMGEVARAADAPVDTQRVAQIRQAIADGTYHVDAQRVADRMIKLEKQIG